jgi:hypothetical protein
LSAARTPEEEHGRWLQCCRDEAGLTPAELAQAIGYTNLKRGTQRISDWEAGVRQPDTTQHPALQRALRRSTMQWRAQGRLLELDLEHKMRHGQEIWRSYLQTERLLAAHSEILMQHRERLVTISALRDIPLPGFRIRGPGRGVPSMTLGGLLSAWGNGPLEVENGNQRLRLFWTHGSTFRGVHTARGFCTQARVPTVFGGVFCCTGKPYRTHLSAIIDHFESFPSGPSDRRLPELIARLVARSAEASPVP